VRKTHASSARANGHHTLAGKHKRTIGLAKFDGKTLRQVFSAVFLRRRPFTALQKLASR